MKIFGKTITLSANNQSIFGKPQSNNMPYTERLTIEPALKRNMIKPIVTPDTLDMALSNARIGWLHFLMDIYEEMEATDPHITSVVQTRKLSIQGYEWKVEPREEDPAQQKVAEFVEEVLESIPDFTNDITDMLDAVFKGYSFMEILWESKDGKVVISDLKFIPQRYFAYDYMNESWKYQTGYGEYSDIPQFKVVKAVSRIHSGVQVHYGLFRSIVEQYIYKAFAQKNWAIFTELHGIPFRVGTYHSNGMESNSADIQNLKDGLKNFAANGYMVKSASTGVEFVEPKANGGSAYKELIDLCNEEISKAILGQTLSTQVGGKGSFAAAKVHNQVREDLVYADRMFLQSIINEQIIAPLVRFNFGDVPMPQFEFCMEENTDLAQRITVDKELFAMGIPFPENYFYETYDIENPSEDAAETKPSPKEATAQ